MRVLIAEDEKRLAELIAEGLRRRAMAVDVVFDGGAASERLAFNDYDVLILDRDLPVMHGDDVCRELVDRRARTRILMLTAAGSVSERVDGLGIGADDYLAKPFDFSELVARVQALARRSQTALPPILEGAGIRLDTRRLEAFRDGRQLRLSVKEFAVLEALLRADGAVVSAEQLLETAWDEFADPFSNVVRVIMSRLRTKLGDPPCIVTVAGAGYRL